MIYFVVYIRETILYYVFLFFFPSHAGVSRSVAVVTAYLMKTNHLTFQEAYAFVQAIKPDAKYDLFFSFGKSVFS